MHRYFYLILSLLLMRSLSLAADIGAVEGGLVVFTPPPGWCAASDTSMLGKSVKVMIIGKGKHAIPPSMNLAIQPYEGTLRDYLKLVKAKTAAQGSRLKDLGMIRTESGPANLSQVDTKSEWGDLRLMHVTLLKNGWIYILTASAEKNEFVQFYKQFFTSMRSLHVYNDLFEAISSPQQREQLKMAIEKLQKVFQFFLTQQKELSPGATPQELHKLAFENSRFQQNAWNSFKEKVETDFADQRVEWRQLLIQQMEQELLVPPSPTNLINENTKGENV